MTGFFDSFPSQEMEERELSRVSEKLPLLVHSLSPKSLLRWRKKNLFYTETDLFKGTIFSEYHPNSRSQKFGMIFSFPSPVPKVGNGIFHSSSQNLGMQISIPVPVTRNGLSKSGIRTGIEFKRWEKEGY